MRNSIANSALPTSKGEAGEDSTRESGLSLLQDPGGAKALSFPVVHDPEAPPIRPERHVGNSIADHAKATDRRLARSLHRCPMLPLVNAEAAALSTLVTHYNLVSGASRKRQRRGHPIVGMLKFAPSLTPEGQRAVTVLVFV